MVKIEKVTQEIKRFLKSDSRGLTIQELSEKTKASRITVSLAMAKLEGAGEIDIRVIGNCKLNYWKGKR